MATQGYSGSVDLISGIRPKNSGTFPLVDAHDVYVAAPDKRLDTALTEKADKTDTYTQSEVDTKIASVQTFSKRIVDTLPEAASADDKTIYLVPRTNSETPDLCDEYVVVEESGARRWERIGGTTVDVDGKRDKTDLAVYDRLADWTSDSGIVAVWNHGTAWSISGGGYLEYISRGIWVLYYPPVGGSSTYSITADEDARSLTFSIPVDGGEPEEITFTRSSIYASSGDSLAKRSELQNLQNVDLPAKLDSTSAAPAFDANTAYDVGDYVTYNGKLYRRTTPLVQTGPGPWDAANWTPADLLSVSSPMMSLTWAKLKDLRDNNELVPGRQYRITDYVAKVSATDAQSANHPFDIIVTADSESKLNEHARAIMHETVLDFAEDTHYIVGDFCKYEGTVYKCTTAHQGEWNADDFTEESPYFYNCNFAAWDVWYCLDNDNTRFAWANTSRVSRGVIYRLIDEWGNDCPYDFKGILFHAYEGENDNYTIVRDTTFRYTFDGGEDVRSDLSIAGGVNGIYGNKIAKRRQTANGQRGLNFIVFKGRDCYRNVFEEDCSDITFGGMGCLNNVFKCNCYQMTFKAHAVKNTFEPMCFRNWCGEWCNVNTFGSACQRNIIGDNFDRNILGIADRNNVFGSGCRANVLADGCDNNTFGDNCSCITLGANCDYIKFGNADYTASNCCHISVATGNRYLYISPTGNPSQAYLYQNVEIMAGVNNTDDWKLIEDPNVGQTHLTIYKPADSEEISI